MSFTLSVIAALLCSIAVSLWRIDQTLRRKTEVKQTFGIELSEEQQTNLFHQIGNIAWEAGRNFQAGTRTDR